MHRPLTQMMRAVRSHQPFSHGRFETTLCLASGSTSIAPNRLSLPAGIVPAKRDLEDATSSESPLEQSPQVHPMHITDVEFFFYCLTS